MRTVGESSIHRSQDNVDDCFIFPPSNHEGLHIVAEEEQHHDDDGDDDDAATPETEPLSSGSAEVERSSQDRPLNSRFRVAGEIVLKRLGLGFEALFRSCDNNSSGRRGVEWFPSASGVTVGLLLVPLLCWWQRRRRRSRKEKERLILLMQRTDEKMSLLLEQITHISEVLSAHHNVPTPRSG